MADRSPKSGRTTSRHTEPTSSPGSADGTLPSNSPDGPTMHLCGPGPAPASRSARRGRKQDSQTTGISGQRGSVSSASAALQSFLESRLRGRLDSTGSTLFALTWREKATPSGRPILQRLASAPRTNGSGSTGWPITSGSLPRGVWATPVSTELGNTLENYRAMKANMTSGARTAITHPSLQALLVTGPMPSGLSALTDDPAHLNPDHSRWLMGFPIGWASYADSETPSSPHLQRSLFDPR